MKESQFIGLCVVTVILHLVVMLIAAVTYCTDNRRVISNWKPLLNLFDRLNDSGKDVYFMLYLPFIPLELSIGLLIFILKKIFKPFYDVLMGSAFKDKE